MSKNRMAVCAAIACAASLAVPRAASSATVSAVSCSSASVAAAVAIAANGDTVEIPAGTCDWTSTVTVNKGITLKGAGIDATTLVDKVTGGAAGLVMSIAPGLSFRLTGLTIQAATTHGVSTGFLQFFGGSSQVRMDHVKFNGFSGSHRVGVNADNIFGVFDHITWIGGFTSFLEAKHSAYLGVGSFGDNSWAQPHSMGSGNALFLEDSTFVNSGPTQSVVDCNGGGCRLVIRNNMFHHYAIGGHGTESPGRGRGIRQMEVYGNSFVSDGSIGNVDSAVLLRSGTGFIFKNSFYGVNGPSPAFNVIVKLRLVRADSNAGGWGNCDGSGPWDKNDGVVYAAGVHTGANGATTLTDSTKFWTANQWVVDGNPYSIRNVTRGWGSEIASNTSNAIESQRSGQGDYQAFNNGDTYQILRAQYCLDQPGRGQSVMLQGFTPSPTGDPRNALEPVYAWNNDVSRAGIPWGVVGTTSRRILAGRDYVVCNDDSCAPQGYTPFSYPHPLVGGAASSSSGPPPPPNVRIVS